MSRQPSLSLGIGHVGVAGDVRMAGDRSRVVGMGSVEQGQMICESLAIARIMGERDS